MIKIQYNISVLNPLKNPCPKRPISSFIQVTLPLQPCVNKAVYLRTHTTRLVMKAIAVLLLLLVLSTLKLVAQKEIGLNPPTMKWRQISTPAGEFTTGPIPALTNAG